MKAQCVLHQEFVANLETFAHWPDLSCTRQQPCLSSVLIEQLAIQNSALAVSAPTSAFRRQHEVAEAALAIVLEMIESTRENRLLAIMTRPNREPVEMAASRVVAQSEHTMGEGACISEHS